MTLFTEYSYGVYTYPDSHQERERAERRESRHSLGSVVCRARRAKVSRAGNREWQGLGCTLVNRQSLQNCSRSR